MTGRDSGAAIDARRNAARRPTKLTEQPARVPPTRALTPLALSGALLVGVSWLSAATFGLFILCFYLASLSAGRVEHWNDMLPGLYAPHQATAVGAIAMHMAAGAFILLVGPVLLMGSVRRRWPALHRWLGRAYVLTCGVAGIGGAVFILAKGTIGGLVMNLGFGLYGLLMLLAAWQAYRYARAAQFGRHRAWAVRLFALAIGSWLYRMDYGLWLTAAHGLGHLESFRGPFDRAMDFFFYLPNLVLAELFLRAKQAPRHGALRMAAAAVLGLSTLVVAVGSYYFIRYYWGPAIVAAVAHLTMVGRTG